MNTGEKNNMELIYVKGDSKTPQRFWLYALVTNEDKKEELVKNGFVFSDYNTKLYKSLNEIQKSKLNLY